MKLQMINLRYNGGLFICKYIHTNVVGYSHKSTKYTKYSFFTPFYISNAYYFN